MPINKKDYPKNWNALSLRIKQKYSFLCYYCLQQKTKHNPLTTHHIDWDTTNNDEKYLRPLHASCHLRFHSTFKKCRDIKTFEEICKNNHSQMKMLFIKEFEDHDYKAKFTRFIMARKYRRKKCLRNSSVGNLSRFLSQDLPIS